MNPQDDKRPLSGPEQYLKPGERLLKQSARVGIKKFHFTAYITERRVFLIEEHERKPGVTSKDIPRDMIIASFLESPGNPDPFLVLTIRTSEDETRTMKLAFIQDGDDRTTEIEEWINLLHGRPLRSGKAARHFETMKKVQREEYPHAKPIAPTGPEAEEERPPFSTPAPVSRAAPVAHYREEAVVMERKAPVPPAYDKNVPKEVSSGTDSDTHETGEVNFCHHCGKRVPQGANFCPYCGTKLHHPKPGHGTG
jgi:hypothetical protein